MYLTLMVKRTFTTSLAAAALAVGSWFALAAPTQATTVCDPTTASDPSCGLKTAIEAQYGEGYCADLYEWQDVGGATLEVHHRYTDAGIGEDGLGTITMEVFPTFTDSNCTVKTTSALEGLDPTYRFYHGITLSATAEIETTPGSEEFTVDLEPNDFSHTFTGLDFTEYQTRFDSNFYNEAGDDRYDSVNEQDYFAPAWPALADLTMAADGTFEWEYAEGPDDSLTRADITLHEITDSGLFFTTFTSKYAPTNSWEYYDWNNVGDGTYLLGGSEAKKSYYDDVYDGTSMDTSGQVNHNIWNEHTYKIVTVEGHVVTSVADIDSVDSDTQEELVDCSEAANDGEDCSGVTESDILGTLDAPTVSKASKKKVTWNAVSGATYYKLKITNKKGKKLLNYNNVSGTSQTITAKKRKFLAAKNKAYVKACNESGCSDWSAAKSFKK